MKLNGWRRLAVALCGASALSAGSLAAYDAFNHRDGYFVTHALPAGTAVSDDKATLPDGRIIDLSPSNRGKRPWDIRWENEPGVPRDQVILWPKLLTRGLAIPLGLWAGLEIFALFVGWIARGFTHETASKLTDAELQQYRSILAQARTLVDWLIAELSDYKVPGTRRSLVTTALFGLTQEHHHAIVNLLEANLKSSASALVRSVFESYVRGLWLSHCATDAQVEAYSTGKEPPNMADLIAAIEKTEIYPDGELSRIKAQAWSTMNQYTHSGGLQVQRWNTGELITPNHSIDEMKEVLEFVNSLALLSAVSIAGSAGDEALAERLVEKAKEIAPARSAKS